MPVPGMPQQLAPAPEKTAPAAIPQGNQGNVSAAMMKVKNAVEMLQEALPLLPFGSEEHKEIITFLGKISKHASSGGGENPGLQLQSLIQQAKQSAESAPQKAMMRMFPPAAPNSGPAMPGAGAEPPTPTPSA